MCNFYRINFYTLKCFEKKNVLIIIKWIKMLIYQMKFIELTSLKWYVAYDVVSISFTKLVFSINQITLRTFLKQYVLKWNIL